MTICERPPVPRCFPQPHSGRPHGCGTGSVRRSARRAVAELVTGTALGACLVLGGSAHAAETTYQRLLNAPAEPQNWLMRMGNYGNWNHSALTQINKTNVANLKVKFMAALSDPNRPSKGNQYFTPLVEDGFHVCRQPVSAILEIRRAGRKADTWCGNSTPRSRAAARACTASRCSATTYISTPAATAPIRG